MARESEMALSGGESNEMARQRKRISERQRHIRQAYQRKPAWHGEISIIGERKAS